MQPKWRDVGTYFEKTPCFRGFIGPVGLRMFITVLKNYRNADVIDYVHRLCLFYVVHQRR